MENNEDNKPTAPTPIRIKPGYKSGAEHWTQKRKAQLAAEAPPTVAQAPSSPPVTEDASPVAPMDERSVYNAEVERIRKTRKPLGAFTQKLAYPERSGYHRHWFNDVPGRIDEAKLSGWAHVDDKGQPVRRIVGTGRDKGALWAFLLEIPSIFWEEDMAAQFARAKAPVDAIRSSPVQAKAGQSKPQDSEKFYSPRESILDIQRK